MSPIVLLFKSLIPAHTRRLKTGKVVNVRQYTDKRTKRMEDDKTLDMFADDDTITTPRQEMIDEHKRLVDVLESPSRKDDKAEAKKQKEELEEYEGKPKTKPQPPEFRDWRSANTAPNAARLYPNKPGAKFTPQNIADLKTWAESQGWQVPSANGTMIDIVAPAREKLDIALYGAQGVKREKQADAVSAGKQKDEDRRQAHRERVSGSSTVEWIDSQFGAESINDYNKGKLADFLEGKDDKFGGLVSPGWLDGVKKLGILTADGRDVDWKKLRSIFNEQASTKPTDDTPQIDAMIARAKALGFDGIGIKASLELYRNGKNPGQGVTSREEGIANLERMLAAAEAKAKPTPRVTSVTQKEGDGKILGYDWEDIQRAQQGGTLSRRVDTSKPVDSDVEKFRESDEKLLAEHGEQGLRDKQFFGVLDRLERTGRLGKPEAPVLKPSEVNGAKLKELIGNGLGVHEFDVEGGGKVKAEVKVTKRNGEVKTKYLHITAIQPGGAWVYYREQANGNFKEVASGRGTPPKVVSVKASKPKADAAPVPRKISRAFSKESFAYRTKNFKVGTVGGWTLLRVPHLEGNGADWELANSYNLVAFDDEQSARQWAAKNRSNNRRYLDESGRYSDGSA